MIKIVNGEPVEMTAEELATQKQDAEQAQAKQAENAMRVERDIRNGKLAACDWTQVVDAPLSSAEKSAWQTYRQALRDVPKQAGFPREIEWPVEPA